MFHCSEKCQYEWFLEVVCVLEIFVVKCFPDISIFTSLEGFTSIYIKNYICFHGGPIVAFKRIIYLMYPVVDDNVL